MNDDSCNSLSLHIFFDFNFSLIWRINLFCVQTTAEFPTRPAALSLPFLNLVFLRHIWNILVFLGQRMFWSL